MHNFYFNALVFAIAVISFNSGTAQDNSVPIFTLDTAYIVNVPIEKISKSYSDNNDAVALEKDYIFKVLNVNFNDGYIYLLKSNIYTGDYIIKRYSYPIGINLDSRCTISAISISQGRIYMKLCEEIVVFEENGEFIGQLKVHSKWQSISTFENGSHLLSFYYNYHFRTSLEKCAIAIIDSSGQILKEVYPPSYFHQLTHFSPNKLVTNNDENIVIASVSEPIINVYNNSLDSLYSYNVADKNWLSASELLKKRKYKKRYKDGIFAFAAEELQFGRLSKALNISYINDSLVYYSYCNGFNEVHDVILKQQENSMAVVRSNTYNSVDYNSWITNNPDSIVPNSKVGFFLHNQKGFIADNKLVYIKTGSKTPLMNVSYNAYRAAETAKDESTNSVYLQVYIFNYTE